MLIHVAIVSDQVLANLIPALMERPDRVILVSTPVMEKRGITLRLQRLIAEEEIAVDVWRDAPDVNVPAILAFASRLQTELLEQHADAEIVLNATGGTKPMAFAFIEAFRGFAARLLYTDTAHRRIELLPNGAAPAEPIPMADVLDIKHYLAAQGLRMGPSDSDSADLLTRMGQRKATAKFLARNAKKMGNLIGALNGLADKAMSKDGKQLVAPMQSLNYPPHPKDPFAEGLRELVKTKCIGWEEGKADVTFIDLERTRFVHGGWLEEYAYHVLADEKLRDVRMSVNVLLEGGNEAHNEFDVLACHGNQLLFIECKTLKFDGEAKDNDIAYKLKSLGDNARGLFGETWLLSAREPSVTLIERARQNRFRLVGPDELANLRHLVRQWAGLNQ